jgi:hypothetical protein
MFLALLKGSKLESRNNEGGIPTVAPSRLTPQSQRLPPILYTLFQNSTPRYSKAARGLSVCQLVNSIFTVATVSPSILWRQRPNHYAIRAGRNLPDKEFRYLRTVIVTAAVYWGLDSKLRAYALTSPHDLPAPGRRQSLYVALRLRRDLCFW